MKNEHEKHKSTRIIIYKLHKYHEYSLCYEFREMHDFYK
jgi:hypothetical protein